MTNLFKTITMFIFSTKAEASVQRYESTYAELVAIKDRLSQDMVRLETLVGVEMSRDIVAKIANDTL